VGVDLDYMVNFLMSWGLIEPPPPLLSRPGRDKVKVNLSLCFN